MIYGIIIYSCAHAVIGRSWPYNQEDKRVFNPNWLLDRYSADGYGEGNFLSSFIFLLASCFLFVLVVARYAFELTVNHLLNNLMKSVQDLMTDLGLGTSLLGKSDGCCHSTRGE